VGNQPTVSLGQEIMKYTTVKISEILKHPTKRMDAGYWIKKKKKAASLKLQAASLTVDPRDDRIHLERGITWNMQRKN
jgi:hypothetical protein